MGHTATPYGWTRSMLYYPDSGTCWYPVVALPAINPPAYIWNLHTSVRTFFFVFCCLFFDSKPYVGRIDTDDTTVYAMLHLHRPKVTLYMDMLQVSSWIFTSYQPYDFKIQLLTCNMSSRLSWTVSAFSWVLRRMLTIKHEIHSLSIYILYKESIHSSV